MSEELILEKPHRESLGLGLLAEMLVALPVLLAFWWSITESGPWAALVSIQLSLFKGFYPGYTFTFCMMLSFGLAALLYHGLVRLGVRGRC